MEMTSLDEILDKKFGVEGSESRKRFEEECEVLYLSECLKETRRKEGLTQQQLADKIGMKRASISRIENGRGDIPLSTLHKLFDGLGKRVSIVIS